MGLFFRLAFFVIYALTLTSMFFVYVAIAITLWLVFIIINVNPFKKHVSSYVLTDLMFLMFISMFYISVLGINIGSMEQHAYLPLINILVMLSLFAAMLYVLYAMLHWMYSRRRWGKELFRTMKYWNFFLRL